MSHYQWVLQNEDRLKLNKKTVLSVVCANKKSFGLQSRSQRKICSSKREFELSNEAMNEFKQAHTLSSLPLPLQLPSPAIWAQSLS